VKPRLRSTRRPHAFLVLFALALAPLATAVRSEAVSVLSIRGRVFSMRTDPLQGAYVRHTTAGVYTDASGAYSLQVTQPGCYLVTASGPNAPAGAYFETSRTICVGVQGTSGQDFRVPYQLYGQAVPSFLNSVEDRSVTQTAMILCPPEACMVKADLYRTGFGADLSTLGEFVGTVTLTHDGTDPEGFSRYQGVIPIPAGQPAGWYQVVREARNPATNELQSRCMFDRCWNYYAVDNAAPRLGSGTPQDWIRTASPLIRIPFTDEQDVGLDLTSLLLRLDGQLVANNLLLLEGNLWSGAVTYRAGGLTDGAHVVSLEVSDRAGNAATPAGFTFTVDTAKPVASKFTPTGSIGTCCPKISALLTDTNSGQIDAASIVMTLSNGVISNRLVHTFDPATGEVWYQVPADVQGPGLGQFPLAQGNYTVKLRAGDLAGNVMEITWTFKVSATATAWVVAMVEGLWGAPLSRPTQAFV
jgi:hypothetical protein